MTFTYRKTKRLAQLLARIERARILIDELPVSPELRTITHNRSLLKSALFSAKIEGVIPSSDERMGRRREVENIVRALRLIYSNNMPKHLSLSLIKKFHQLVMSRVSADAGTFRREPSGIFNTAGVAVYIAPSPMMIKTLLGEFVQFCTVSKEPVPIITAMAHVWFEKIHPFLDGNGRVGRLLMSYLLQQGGYGMQGTVPIETEIDEHREEYYDVLLEQKKDITNAVTFLLEALAVSAERVVHNLKYQEKESVDREEFLLPRRREILDIIRDHKLVSFDFLRRRFMAVSAETIHYDLKQLTKEKLVRKLGNTRGARYKTL